MKKGQVFSLDLIIAMVVVVFGIGLIIQFSETKIYEQKEQQFQNELESIGKTASMLLVSNPAIVCELRDNGNTSILAHLENCIDTSDAGTTITNASLGIPTDYEFIVLDEIGGKIAATNAGITEVSTTAENIFSEKRLTVLYSGIVIPGAVSKGELEWCMASGCNLEQEVTIAVWRAA